MKKSKKWILAQWSAGLGTIIAIAGVVGVLCSVEGATAMVTQGVGLIAGTLTIYGVENVVQKGVVGAHYREELDKGD